jgi:4-amino-4-deoxy-L-arabinose transferase-like glycosyltransferase
MEESALDEKTVRRWLWTILAVTAVLPMAFYLGPRYGDHFEYVRLADQLARGTLNPAENRYSMRLGLILPMAAFQAVFRSWAAASLVLTLLASLAHVGGVFALGRSLGGPRLGLRAAALVAVLPLEIINGSTPFPDLLTAALGTWALVLVHRESSFPTPRPGLLLAAGALLGWGYFTKQTIVFHLLLMGAWTLSDRRWRRGLVVVPVLAALALEAGILAAAGGTPFGRSLDARADAGPLLEQWYPASGGLASRILWQIPSLLLNPLAKDFPYLAGLAWLFLAAIKRLRGLPEGKKVAVGVAIVLVQIWFWPCSLSPYVPALLAEGRHLFPAVALLAVGAATLWSDASPRRRSLLWAGWGAACLVGTLGIYTYLSREDVGLREAHRFLKSQGVESVRVLDVWGHEPGQIRYLEGPRGRMRIRDYRIEDLERIRGEHVVVDDRTRVLGAGDAPMTTGRDLAIPAGWALVWERSFPSRWDPRTLLRGRPSGAGDYRVRIYRVP